MSDALPRQFASRGRRGGRGGSRGGRAGSRSSSKAEIAESAPPIVYEDEGEIGQLKKKYAAYLPQLKELFADWTDEDLVFALEDANGDLESVIEHITDGTAVDSLG
jgi:hypothetical protein